MESFARCQVHVPRARWFIIFVMLEIDVVTEFGRLPMKVMSAIGVISDFGLIMNPAAA